MRIAVRSAQSGDGLSYLRQPIGASDFVAKAAVHLRRYGPPAQTDYAQRHFSIAHDEAEILPLLREGQAAETRSCRSSRRRGSPPGVDEKPAQFADRPAG